MAMSLAPPGRGLLNEGGRRVKVLLHIVLGIHLEHRNGKFIQGFMPSFSKIPLLYQIFGEKTYFAARFFRPNRISPPTRKNSSRAAETMVVTVGAVKMAMEPTTM